MSSPFPGMDPYLERPALWPDVHHELISVAREALNSQLRPKYHVRIAERVYISDEGDPGRAAIVPDLHVAARPDSEAHRLAAPDAGAAVDVAGPVVVTTLIDEEVREARLEILDSAQRQVVAVIELLSPANTVAGSRGRASFEQKRQEVLGSPAHWIEIDLLRTGLRFPTLEEPPPCEYRVLVSHAARRPRGLLWPIRLSQRLPRVSVPLLPGDPDAPLDLQAVLTTAYDRAAYDLAIDYGADPVPPLEGESAEWARRLLRDKGVRSPDPA